jgi:aryl-alcohol dehydrogenase-like predicted oxidoreductase
MEKRVLGRSSLQVSAFGFGLMTFGDGSGPFRSVGSTQREAKRQIDLAIDAGVNFFDTADVYSRGRSEEILAEALQGKRQRVLIATKVFGSMGKDKSELGLSRHHVVRGCEQSLVRLNTDWIDLYQVHNHDGLVPIEETLRALEDLTTSGKVRYIGCSNHFAWQLTKALSVSERLGLERYVSQQIQYSLLVRDVETEILPTAIDQGVGSIVWSPLAGGYLTGKFTTTPPSPTRLIQSGLLSIYDQPRGTAVIGALRDIAAAHEGATIAQTALNWVRSRPGVVSVLVGARTAAQLVDNLAAARWDLNNDEISRLDLISETPPGYPESTQRIFHPERNPSRFYAPLRESTRSIKQ